MENALLLLTGSLFIALFIERLLELIKALFSAYETKHDRYQRWNKLSKRIANQLYHRISHTDTSKFENFHLKLVSQYLFSTHPNYQGTYILTANRVRSIFLKYLAKTIGIIFGICFALSTQLNVFVLVKASTPTNEVLPDLFNASFFSGNLGVIISGIIIGLGAGPMHKFIVALERARQKRKNTTTE